MNKEKIDYIDDSIKSILEPTYGIIVYQEQIMQIAQQFAGFRFSSRCHSQATRNNDFPNDDALGKKALKNRLRVVESGNQDEVCLRRIWAKPKALDSLNNPISLTDYLRNASQ